MRGVGLRPGGLPHGRPVSMASRIGLRMRSPSAGSPAWPDSDSKHHTPLRGTRPYDRRQPTRARSRSRPAPRQPEPPPPLRPPPASPRRRGPPCSPAVARRGARLPVLRILGGAARRTGAGRGFPRRRSGTRLVPTTSLPLRKPTRPPKWGVVPPPVKVCLILITVRWGAPRPNRKLTPLKWP